MGRQAFAVSHSLTLLEKAFLMHPTLQHVHGTFMTSALGMKEVRFITTITVTAAVTVWVLFGTQTCESSCNYGVFTAFKGEKIRPALY